MEPDDLKCCGNCKYNDCEDSHCPHGVRMIDRYLGAGYCEEWAPDGIKQADRIDNA